MQDGAEPDSAALLNAITRGEASAGFAFTKSHSQHLCARRITHALHNTASHSRTRALRRATWTRIGCEVLCLDADADGRPVENAEWEAAIQHLERQRAKEPFDLNREVR